MPRSIPLVDTHVATRGLVSTIMAERFSQLQPIWVAEQLNVFCELRRIFGNDLDKPIILAVIGQRQFETDTEAPYSHDEARSRPRRSDRSRLTNIESVALASGIPRETVRRKVNEMSDSGWLLRDRRGALSVTAMAADELATATEFSYHMLDAIFEVLANALVDDGKLKVEVVAQSPG